MKLTMKVIIRIASLLRRILIKMILCILDRPVRSATKEEKQLIEDLKNKFNLLSHGIAQANREWSNNMARLYKLVMNNDIRSFLRWDVIQRTMFVTNAYYISKELNYLKKSADWKQRWSKGIIESRIGHPVPFVLYPKSSGNLIHHAYHLAQFEEKTGVNINELDIVFEFGGGYGSMCRLFYNLGFNANYVVYDLPPFSVLQEYYLKALSIPVHSISSAGRGVANGVVCFSNMKDLQKFLISSIKIGKTSKSLFIAGWSLSETPIKIRDSIVPLISNFANVLIGYQTQFGQVDNVQYFDKFKDNFTCNMTWHNWEIKHLPSSYYLIGSSEN